MSINQLKDFVDGNFQFVVNHYKNNVAVMSDSALIFNNDIQSIKHNYCYVLSDITKSSDMQIVLCAALIEKVFENVSERKMNLQEFQEVKDILKQNMFERLYEF